MKKTLSFILPCFILLVSAAQVPTQINYQGIARNSVGNVLPNQPVTVRLSIRDGSAAGTVLYSETRNVITNVFGLFYYGIGSPGAGPVTGSLGNINWATGNKYLQVEIDPKGGTSFNDAGTTQLLSVPYAIYAAGASPTGNAGGSLTGTYPNPTVANAAITLPMIAPGVLPTTLPPSGPAGGALTGIYPNPLIAPGAVIQSMIAPGVTLPPNGPAGGSLTGSYPNPLIANGAVTQAMIAPGATLPPSGAASGDLAGSYPNPTVSRIQGRSVNNTAPVMNDVLSFNGTSWGPVSPSGIPGIVWTSNGTNINNSNTGNVGIGTNTPNYKLDVVGGIASAGGGGIYDVAVTASGRIGVIGTSLGVAGNAGVFGNGSPNAYGVWGTSDNSAGIFGTSDIGKGVSGFSRFGLGGYFYSYNGVGLWAKTDRSDANWAGVFEGNVLTYGSYQTSDKNLKKDIKDVSDAMSVLMQLKPKIYEFRSDGKLSNLHLPRGKHYGVLAQDIEEVLPNLVNEVETEISPQPVMEPTIPVLSTENPKEISRTSVEATEKIKIKAVNYTELIPIIVKAIQEQQQIIAEQKTKIVALEARLSRLESILTTSTQNKK